MTKTKKYVLSYLILLTFVLTNVIGAIGIIPVHAEENKPVQNRDSAAAEQPVEGQAVRGIPELTAVPAAQEDIDALDKSGADSINFKSLPALNSTKTFYAYNNNTKLYDAVPSVLKKISTHSYIYLQNGVTTVTDAMLNDISAEFEKIYSKNISIFGAPPDIDNDKRVNILLLDIQDSGGGTYIAGFFDSRSELPRIYHNTTNNQSNESEVFFMDIVEGFPDTASTRLNFLGTLAHEFQHMIQYGVYLRNYTSINEIEHTWLNEALSCLAEYINYNEHPLGQIKYFLADYLPDYSGLIDWEGSLANYGASYMFGLYMYEQFGEAFISDLAQDPAAGIDSINNQLAASGKNIDFDELFEKSQVAIAVDGDGEFGYSTIDIPAIRQASYSNPGSIPDMRFYSLSTAGAYNGTAESIITYEGTYRSYAGFLDGSKTEPALNVLFGNNTGSYYIVKPATADVANTYATFSAVPKIIEKIQPDTSVGNKIEFGNDQWAMLIYIAGGTAIDNTITVTPASAPTPDTIPSKPQILSANPSYNTVWLTWSPSSFTGGVKGYNVYRNGSKLNTSGLVLTTSYTDHTANALTSYSYEVEAVGYNDSKSEKSAAVPVLTNSIPSNYAKYAPILSIIGTDASLIEVRIAAPMGYTNIDHFEVIALMDGMEDSFFDVGNIPGDFELMGFEDGITYTLYAFAVDVLGNYSPASNKLYVKSGVNGGVVSLTQPPTVPTNVTASTIKETKVTLQWTASTQAEGILEYNVYRGGVFAGKTAGNATQFTDSGLTAYTPYIYTIEAVGGDAKHLNSEYSAPLTVTTLAGPPALTADTTDTSVDDSLVITFPYNTLWRNSISAIKVDGAVLSETNYSKSAGQITLNPGAIPKAGSHTITVVADGYSDTQVQQVITIGAINASKSTAVADKPLSLGSTNIVTLTAKDRGGNVIAGHQFYMDITIFSNSAATNESYTVARAVYTASAPITVTEAVYTNIVAGDITNVNGQSTVQVIMPNVIDYNDGISIQFKLAADGSDVGSPIGYIRTQSSGGNNDDSGNGGGGGGGGGGSSSTTTTAPTPAATSAPGETIVTTETINTQINSTTNIITVNVTGTNNGQTAVIPSDVLRLLDSKDKIISIKTNDVTMTFAPEIIGSDLANMAKDSSLKVSIKKLASDAVSGTLPSISDDRNKGLFRIGNSIFQFEAKLVGKDKTTDLTNFSKDITITISLKDADLSAIDTEKLGVYYFNEKSKAWEYVGGKYDPATKSITFATNHFSYYAVMKYEKSFSDIKGHWAQTDIENLASKHIFKNIADEKFDPQAKITRAEFIAMLVRALELKAADVEPIAFKDIVKEKYYYGEVMTAWKLGITTGDDTGKFRPSDNITREQLAAMIGRALTYLNKSPNLTEAQVSEKLSAYTDKDNVSSFARNAMAIALEKKIINGWKTDLLAPKENATRAEAAVMLQRLLNGL